MLKELDKKKKELYKEIDELDEQIRLKRLGAFISFLHNQKQTDMLEQNFDEHHELMEGIVKCLKVCLTGTEDKVSYERFSDITIGGKKSLTDKEDFICISNDYVYLYDIISFFEEEYRMRADGHKESVWVNDHRLDNFLANIENDYDIELWWYEENQNN